MGFLKLTGLVILLTPLAVQNLKGQIVINEIYINAGANDGSGSPNTGEWIEFYNTTAAAVDVSCWAFCDGDFCVVFPSGTTIAANDFFTVGSATGVGCVTPPPDECDFPGFVPDLDWATCGCTGGSSVGVFTNSSEQVILYSSSGTIVDAIIWSGGQLLPTAMSTPTVGACASQSVTLPIPSSGVYEDIGSSNGGAFDKTSKARQPDGGTTWITESSPTIDASNSGILPIELLFFKAKVQPSGVLLEWSTASEINNDFFTIERSPDAKEFSIVTELPGAGNSEQILDYSLIDTRPLIGPSYYRLKQTDFDGTISYSPFVRAQVTNPPLELYPNPVTKNLNINWSAERDEVITLEVMDFQGRVVSANEFNVTPGGNLLHHPTHLLSPGLYFAHIGDYSIQKFIKK